MDIDARIAQFETMVRPGADPHNDRAWFSLGQAYAQAGRHRDAANAFIRCCEINAAMSKAYQLAGQALIEVGDTDRAVQVLTQGYGAAAGRGDRLPQKAMGEMLLAMGAPVPQTAGSQPPPGAATGGGSFVCARSGQPGRKMSRPPFKGPVGRWIFEHISQDTFDAWLKQGTKVINELRLDLSRESDGEAYEKHMREFLGIDEELYASLTGSAPT